MCVSVCVCVWVGGWVWVGVPSLGASMVNGRRPRLAPGGGGRGGVRKPLWPSIWGQGVAAGGEGAEGDPAATAA